jgi:hypothetical protein
MALETCFYSNKAICNNRGTTGSLLSNSTVNTSCNNSRIVGSGVFCMVGVKAIWGKWVAVVSQMRMWVSSETVTSQQGCEHGSRGMSSVGYRYQATTSGDHIRLKRLTVCYSYMRMCRFSDSIIIICSYNLEVFNKSNHQSNPMSSRDILRSEVFTRKTWIVCGLLDYDTM